MDEKSENSLETYMQPLIYAVTGFNVMDISASSNGDQSGQEILMKAYWDNEGGVYKTAIHVK